MIIVLQKSFKRLIKTGVRVQNHLLNLCSCDVNSQRLFCIQKAGVKLSGKQSYLFPYFSFINLFLLYLSKRDFTTENQWLR